jgi:hypothetical protein
MQHVSPVLLVFVFACASTPTHGAPTTQITSQQPPLLHDDAGPRDAGPLPTCERQPSVVGACVMRVSGPGQYSNEEPVLPGTIVDLGEQQARPECFGSDNWPHVLPGVTLKGVQGAPPPGALWWRFDDGKGTQYVLGVAAPGAAELGVSIGDAITLDWPVSWGGDFGFGTATVKVGGRGTITYVLNATYSAASTPYKVIEGASECLRVGTCAGREWSMKIAFDDQSLTVPQHSSKRLGNETFTSGYGFTRAEDGTDGGQQVPGLLGCGGPATQWFFAVVKPEPMVQ